ncbi:MAG: hypothetical protein HRT71_19280 [Flavobacteriales bacterium]|nr:hypothetical protein [Flavobacteriales bacterium]
MNRIAVLLLFVVFICSCEAEKQELVDNKDLIQKGKLEMDTVLNQFLQVCILNENIEDCIDDLMDEANDEYQMFALNQILYEIDPVASFKLITEIIEEKPNELSFILQYAIELHRGGKHADAISYYNIYQLSDSMDFRIHTWLSECYLNVGNFQMAMDHWAYADNSYNQKGMDAALYIIHGNSDQLRVRSELIKKVWDGDAASAYDLIHRDMNWEANWWKTYMQDFLLRKDLVTVAEVFGEGSQVTQELRAYNYVKHLREMGSHKDTIGAFLHHMSLIVGGNPLPVSADIASDMLSVTFYSRVMDGSYFFKTRGSELYTLADAGKSGKLNKLISELEAYSRGSKSQSNDKKGWQEYKDEKSAIRYLIGKADNLKYGDPELEQAILDFPNSAKLQWIKFNCAGAAKVDVQPVLLLLMLKEFRSLGSDNRTSSGTLNTYFYWFGQFEQMKAGGAPPEQH